MEERVSIFSFCPFYFRLVASYCNAEVIQCYENNYFKKLTYFLALINIIENINFGSKMSDQN